VAAANILWRGAHSEPANQAPTRAQIWALVQKEVAADYAIGDPSLKILWDYGRMIETSRPQESAEVFRQLLAMQPDRAEVSIELATALLAGGQTIEAARVLTALPRVLSSEDAPRAISRSPPTWRSAGAIATRPACSPASSWTPPRAALPIGNRPSSSWII
jgi:hypothetical protein